MIDHLEPANPEVALPLKTAAAHGSLTNLLADMRRSGSPIAWRRQVEELIDMLPEIEKGLKP